MLTDYPDTSERERRERLDVITSESQRLAALIDRVLDFSRIEHGQRPYVLERGDLAATVRHVVDAYAEYLRRRGGPAKPTGLVVPTMRDVREFNTSPAQTDFPSLRAMDLGNETIRRFRIDWPRDNPTYRLGWHNDAGSDAVLVRCSEVATSDSGTACSAWTVTPYTDGRAAVMVRTRKGYAPVGSVIMPFEMVVKVQ